MSIFESIVSEFNTHLDTMSRNIESTTPHIAEATHLFAEALLADKKIICCTSGDNFSTGNQFCHSLTHGTGLPRPGLPALLLGTHTSSMLSMLSNGTGDDIFSQQIQALGNSNDILFIISSSGNEQNLIEALAVAEEKNMPVVALLASQQNRIASIIGPSNVIISIEAETTQQTLIMQYMIGMLLASLVEQQLFGTPES